VLAVDVTNLSSATLLDSMEPSAGSLDGYGGANVMFGAGLANPTTLLVGGSTSTGGANNGVGELVVLDVTNPAAMSIVTSLSVPNTVQIYTPVLLGNFAVALGDTGGWKPGTINSRGSLVLTTFDITNPRSPAVLSSIVLLPYTNFREGPAVQIGPNQSLFAGVSDSSGNPLLLLVRYHQPAQPDSHSLFGAVLCNGNDRLPATCCMSPPAPPVTPSIRFPVSQRPSTISPEAAAGLSIGP